MGPTATIRDGQPLRPSMLDTRASVGVVFDDWGRHERTRGEIAGTSLGLPHAINALGRSRTRSALIAASWMTPRWKTAASEGVDMPARKSSSAKRRATVRKPATRKSPSKSRTTAREPATRKSVAKRRTRARKSAAKKPAAKKKATTKRQTSAKASRVGTATRKPRPKPRPRPRKIPARKPARRRPRKA